MLLLLGTYCFHLLVPGAVSAEDDAVTDSEKFREVHGARRCSTEEVTTEGG